MEHTLDTIGVAQTYDRLYRGEKNRHNPLMGTEIDYEYDRATKTQLTQWCADAPKGDILEIGAGSGNLSPYIKSYLPGRAHVAVDISTEGLKTASEKSNQIEAATADMMKLPFSDQTFAVIILADTLEHAPNIEESLKEISRVLIPGGIVAVNVPTPNSVRNWIINLVKQGRTGTIVSAAKAAVKRKILYGKANFQPYDADFEPDEWAQLFIKTNFEVEEQKLWPQEVGLVPLTAMFRLRKK